MFFHKNYSGLFNLERKWILYLPYFFSYSVQYMFLGKINILILFVFWNSHDLFIKDIL